MEKDRKTSEQYLAEDISREFHELSVRLRISVVAGVSAFIILAGLLGVVSIADLFISQLEPFSAESIDFYY